MDDILGLNEIELNNNSSSYSYFEEEDKREELYIKMIEERIMFKIKKELIEPLISDYTIKTDINMCEILKLKDDISELKECVEREKNKNIELTEEIDRLNDNYLMEQHKKNELKEHLTNIQNDMVRIEDNLGQMDTLNEKFTNMEHNIKDNVTEINKISNIISKLKVPFDPSRPLEGLDERGKRIHSPLGLDITTKHINYMHQDDNNNTYSPKLDIKIFYNLEILHLNRIHKVDFQYLYKYFLVNF